MEITLTELQPIQFVSNNRGKLQEQLTSYTVKDNLSLNCPPRSSDLKQLLFWRQRIRLFTFEFYQWEHELLCYGLKTQNTHTLSRILKRIKYLLLHCNTASKFIKILSLFQTPVQNKPVLEIH